MSSLPPPDPHESVDEPTGTRSLPAPVVWFAFGPADPEADRLATRFLDLRPGLLIVLHRS